MHTTLACNTHMYVCIYLTFFTLIVYTYRQPFICMCEALNKHICAFKKVTNTHTHTLSVCTVCVYAESKFPLQVQVNFLSPFNAKLPLVLQLFKTLLSCCCCFFLLSLFAGSTLKLLYLLCTLRSNNSSNKKSIDNRLKSSD